MRGLSLLAVLMVCALATVDIVASTKVVRRNRRKPHRDIKAHEEKGYFLHLGKEALEEQGKKESEENSSGPKEKVSMFRFVRTKVNRRAFAETTASTRKSG